MTAVLHNAWDQASTELNRLPVAEERFRYAAVVKPLLSLPRTAAILEAGCGAGRTLRTLDNLGFTHLTGLEISHERLRTVQAQGPHTARLINADTIPFADQTFDAVVAAAVIEHIPEPLAWLGELSRVVKAGGMISIVTDTYMWALLKKLDLYRTIQPVDDAIRPGRLIGAAKQHQLKLIGHGGFINTPTQRAYCAKQLLRKLPASYRLRRWLDERDRHIKMPQVANDETTMVRDAIERFDDMQRPGRLGCHTSYECYYWFRKC